MRNSGKKRIALILASIHTGSALNVWSSFAREASAEDMTLFIFPGGKLASPTDMEYLRNPIYSLVNPDTVDGVISWSSTIGYTVSAEEFGDFHRAFEELPYMTIAHKVANHPCVKFDAYNGMKNLVTHFITRHNARKIAFLRGPENHSSAQNRFNGYCDALKEAHCPYNEKLVTDPAGWANGASACVQLIENRSLVPGKDFDTLIGSSDMMVLPAVQYLQKQGYSMPQDYRAGGFNNSAESKILNNPLSTVRVPYTELSGVSFKIIKKLFGAKGSSGTIDDVVLPCDPIIRESCGCSHKEHYNLNGVDKTALPLIAALKEKNVQHFLGIFKDNFSHFLESGGDIDDFLEVIAYIRNDLSADMEGELYRIMTQMQEQSYSNSQYQREKWHSSLNSLKCELLGTRDRESLVQSLARHLPKIGIFTAAVMLYEDDHVSECVGNFYPGGINTKSKQRFPSGQLFPQDLSDQYASGIFMVQPLFIENRSLGYFIHNVPFYDGVILEELRSTVSNAIKGIFLFEETDRAKQIAEQAEKAKTEFFAVIGNNLYDPFSEITNIIAELEKKNSGVYESAGIAEQINLLKSSAALRQDQINHLIDLSLSHVDEFSFKKRLFLITDIINDLKGQGPFPYLSGDTMWLEDAFSLIREVYGNIITAKMLPRGLEIRFSSPPPPPVSTNGEWTKHTLQFAERIVHIHNGEFTLNENACILILPWITFTGQNPVRAPAGKNNYVLALSPVPIDTSEIFGLPFIESLEKAAAIPGRIAFIIWESDGKGEDQYAKVSELRALTDFFHTPFLCFGEGLSGETLSAAVDAHLQNEKKRAILFIGLDDVLFSSLTDYPAVHISSASELADAVAVESPGLIAMGAIDIEAIKAIRRHPVTAMIPVIVLPELIANPEEVNELCRFPQVVLCNRNVAASPEFIQRIRAIAADDSILPMYTGALVKKVILYFNQHAKNHISRWKLADSVNVSEDYLTRIFRKEMGCSLWEYLNLYRVSLAVDLLTHTGETIYEIAMHTGFQDQAYFCRVFKKIYGKAPGQLRNTQKVGKIQ